MSMLWPQPTLNISNDLGALRDRAWRWSRTTSAVQPHGRIGPMRLQGFRVEYWTYIEHIAFWVAVVLALLSVIVK
jgi:hypothetical protein